MPQILNNPDQFPTDAFLQSVLADNLANYLSVMDMFAKYDIDVCWRFYNDGKNWLCKAQRKRKTVLWLSVYDDSSFRLTFYFNPKTQVDIPQLNISLDADYLSVTPSPSGKFIPLTFEVRTPKPLHDIEQVILYRIPH